MSLSEREREILEQLERDLGSSRPAARLDGWVVADRFVPRWTGWLVFTAGLVAMVTLLHISFLASFIGALAMTVAAAGLVARPSTSQRRKRATQWLQHGPLGGDTR